MSATQQTQTGTAANHVNIEEARETADVLVEHMTAQDIRSWMSENGLTRSRAARKRTSALQAYSQSPALAVAKAEELLDEAGRFTVSCSCGLEERFAEADGAEEAAREHKSGHNTHFPRARGPEGERIYG